MSLTRQGRRLSRGLPVTHHGIEHAFRPGYYAGMHTPQARQQAETLYTQRGAAYAAEQTGIPAMQESAAATIARLVFGS